MDGTDAGRASATEAIRRTLALYCQLGGDGRWRFALREIVFLGDAPELSVSAVPTVSRAQPPPG